MDMNVPSTLSRADTPLDGHDTSHTLEDVNTFADGGIDLPESSHFPQSTRPRPMSKSIKVCLPLQYCAFSLLLCQQ